MQLTAWDARDNVRRPAVLAQVGGLSFFLTIRA